jgi:predicted lipoprotein with Yx(FWY)xxD motif
MKIKSLIKLFILLSIPMLVIVACKKEDPLPSVDITIKDSSLGKILTDGYGKTLYFFTKDVAGTSACSGGCTDAWPIFSVENLRLDVGLTATDFATITRADGKKQVTYKGWPLYYYATDAIAGDVKG